jgi:hypothetical protein
MQAAISPTNRLLDVRLFVFSEGNCWTVAKIWTGLHCLQRQNL